MSYLGANNYGNQGFAAGQDVSRHNDSLFESSKASTNNQTSLVRRQFNKNQ